MNCSCLSVHSSSPVHLQATINLKRKKQQIISVELAAKAGKRMGRVSERYLTRTFINVCEDIFHYHILPRHEKKEGTAKSCGRVLSLFASQRVKHSLWRNKFCWQKLFISLLILIEKRALQRRN